MPRYDAQRSSPPAPMATVELRTRGKSVADVAMLIDSGQEETFVLTPQVRDTAVSIPSNTAEIRRMCAAIAAKLAPLP